MIFIIFYIYSYLYLCIYTPSYPHFKAFPASKLNSETSFLSQLFKVNLNVRVLKPCKLINKVFLFYFHYYLYLFIYLFMHLYLCFNENNLKPCKMFICVCMYASVYKFHSLKAMQANKWSYFLIFIIIYIYSYLY